jgi:phosphoribosylformimino-5-aminoimidazole carboxamide ribotide isomerase
MRILPVLDLLNGVVVRGVGGRRDKYRPVVSRLVDTPDVHSVACAFRDHLGLTRLYVADLDAIVHQRPNRDTCRRLTREGFELLIDAGSRTVEMAQDVVAAGAARVIAGLETWPGPEELAQLCRAVGGERVLFSLDLLQGRPLGDCGPWGTSDPLEIGTLAAKAGVHGIIVLDLAQVGSRAGVTTLTLCRQLRKPFPKLHLVTGGGVHNVSDLQNLAAEGIDAALVASALHDRRITRQDLEGLAGANVPHTQDGSRN